ncbi:AraC family transcriptional regulator [Pseudonocardia spinosispora]|uniref:AraC family transcriptional regulator n=1 Tax=Pseudonocardia spinosispora TaxID=103441 RepID=UPI000411214A|nr:AraC family transcriptional regulator [Pseudonocardia spinosispora]
MEEIRRIISDHADDRELPIPGLVVLRSERPTPPTVTMSGTILGFVAQGLKRVSVGDRTYDYSAGQYLVTSADLPITGCVLEATPATPYLGFGLVLDSAVIAELLLTAPDPPESTQSPALAVLDASAELCDASLRLLRLLDRPDDVAVLGPSTRREVVWRLMQGSAVVRQLGLRRDNAPDVRRAIHWLRHHYAEPVRVEELARLAAMSTSTFHKVFATVTAMSPIQFQKRIRLQEARRLLVAGETDVTSAAHAVGYDSSSQFSREYRRLFGAPPGRDSRTLRVSGRLQN